jgi:hypothetical protein
MTRKQDNLVELWHRFTVNTNAALAFDEMKVAGTRNSGLDLKVLLRDHQKEEIDDTEEVILRDAFDNLLAFYSCVEIAATIGFVPNLLPAEFRSAAVKTLCNRDVRRYYRKHYPLLLPDMLLARIAGLRKARENADGETMALFFEFLHISSMLEEDPSVDVLLWFLDDGYYGEYDWQSTLAILRKPHTLMKVLRRQPSGWNPAERSVDGLRKFVDFCVAFDDLLVRSAAFPLFRSAIWNYHSYWFRMLRGEVRAAVDEALDSLQAWSTSPAPDQLSKRDARALSADAAASSRRVRQAVRRLTGAKYGRELGVDSSEIRRASVQAAARLQP